MQATVIFVKGDDYHDESDDDDTTLLVWESEQVEEFLWRAGISRDISAGVLTV